MCTRIYRIALIIFSFFLVSLLQAEWDVRMDYVKYGAKMTCKEDRGISELSKEFIPCVVEEYKKAISKKKAEKRISKMAPYKSTCADIGFKEGTEKFGKCVLKLYKRDKSNNQLLETEILRKEEQMEADRRYEIDRERELELAKQRLELEKRRVQIEEERANREKWNSISKGLKDLSNTLYPNSNQQNNNTTTNRRMNCTNNNSNLPNAVPSVTCREF
jgi:hypothetical protein